MECIYECEDAYYTDQFDMNDPVQQQQEEYLEKVATEEWVDLIALFIEIKSKGTGSYVFPDQITTVLNQSPTLPTSRVRIFSYFKLHTKNF